MDIVEPAAPVDIVEPAAPADIVEPAAPAESAEGGIGLGVWEVGAEVVPGVYQTVVPDGERCVWERLSGVTGDFDDIIASGFHEGGDRVIVEIPPADTWFSSNGCGRWQPHVAPAEPVEGIGSGVWEVGAEVVPGVYQTVVPDGERCVWARLSGVSGDFDDIIASGFHEGGDRAIVEIPPTDAWFSSDGCGRWQPHVAPAEPVEGIGSGVWEVGAEVVPGIYQTVVPDDELCVWERLSGVTGDFDDFLASGFHEGGDRVVVEILPTDAWFSSVGCGRWQPHVAPAEPVEGIGSGVWEVGAEVVPGIYQTVVPDDELCVWERLSGVTGDFDDFLASGFHEGGDRVIVEILPTDAWFSSNGCGRWQPR